MNSRIQETDRHDGLTRKEPTQTRARITVESILQATSEMLKNTSYHDITTKKIADRVGISVGSLYQYFPNKDAIVLAILEETILELAKRMRDQMYNDSILSDEAVITDKDQGLYKTIEVAVEMYEENSAILVDLFEEAPELKTNASALSANSLLFNAARLFLKSHPPEIDVDHAAISFAMEGLIFDTIKRFVKADPKPCDREELIEIIASIVIAYYQRIGVLSEI